VADEICKAKECYSTKHFCRKAKLDEDGKQLTMPAYEDHQQGKYLASPEGSTIFLLNYHAHYVFDWTDHETGQCINL